MSKIKMTEDEKNRFIEELKKDGKTNLFTVIVVTLVTAVSVYYIFVSEYIYFKILMGLAAAGGAYFVFSKFLSLLRIIRTVRDLQSDEKREQTWDELIKSAEDHLEKEEEDKRTGRNGRKWKMILAAIGLFLIVTLIWFSARKPASSFTNSYGTSTTKCRHSGCSNYIASSGDTAYCETHSNRCMFCKEYCNENTGICRKCMKKHFWESN